MTYYFDVKETFIKTIAVEADNFTQAKQRINKAWHRGEFEIDHNNPDDVEFIYAQETIEKYIKDGYFTKEELETLDCNDVVYNGYVDGYECPVCGKFIVELCCVDELEYPLPKYCNECGTRLEY